MFDVNYLKGIGFKIALFLGALWLIAQALRGIEL